MEKERIRILVIDDDPGDIELLGRCLEKIPQWDIELLSFSKVEDVEALVDCDSYSIVFLDYMIGEKSGIDVFNTLRDRGCKSPIIMITGQGSEQIAVEAMKSGIADYITKNALQPESLYKTMAYALQQTAMRRIIEEQQKKIYEMAINDELTGFYNRRYFMIRFEEEVARSTRYQIPLCLILLDLDYFKKVNDTYGHLMGDNVLSTIARRIQSLMRRTDITGRYGGEELTILLTNTDLSGAEVLAERIRQVVEKEVFTSDGNIKFTVSCSMGLVCLDDERKRHPDKLLKLADEALYKAKNQGRNQVVVSLNNQIDI